MATSQFKIKENEEAILEIIGRLEKLGWHSIFTKAVKNKYNEYFITITGETEMSMPQEKVAGAENAIKCSLTKHFKNPYVEIRLPYTESKKQKLTKFFVVDDEMYRITNGGKL